MYHLSLQILMMKAHRPTRATDCCIEWHMTWPSIHIILCRRLTSSQGPLHSVISGITQYLRPFCKKLTGPQGPLTTALSGVSPDPVFTSYSAGGSQAHKGHCIVWYLASPNILRPFCKKLTGPQGPLTTAKSGVWPVPLFISYFVGGSQAHKGHCIVCYLAWPSILNIFYKKLTGPRGPLTTAKSGVWPVPLFISYSVGGSQAH